MSFITRICNFLMAGIMVLTGFLFTGQLPPGKMPAPEQGALSQYVNPFVGTGALPWTSGMTSPGAAAPFGLVRLGPDTCWPFGWNMDNVGTGGYYYAKTHIYGFSHCRVSGAGLIEGGYFRVTPGLGNADPLKRMEKPLLFSHEKETAQPGYYSVWLPEAACLAELTASVHTGVHRYTFSSAKDAHLFFDVTGKLKGGMDKGSVEVVDKYTLRGSTQCGVGPIYFYAKFSQPFDARVWSGGSLLAAGKVSASQERQSASDVGVDLNFGSVKGKAITLRLGMSHVSLDGARANFNAECDGKSFEEVYKGTLASWESRLGSIKIEASRDIKRNFYTALYHCMLHPTTLTYVTGRYLGFRQGDPFNGPYHIGTASGFTYRSDMSLWDTYRTTHPLYCLIAPDIQKDSVQSLLRMAALLGDFPRWPKTGGDGGSMFGDPANMVIAESYLKGLMSRADAETALAIMKNTANNKRTIWSGDYGRAIEVGRYYREDGFIPAEWDKISVSRALEYAWADYSTALLAQALGRTADYDTFLARSKKALTTLFDPSTKYFSPKNAAGEFQRVIPWMDSYLNQVLQMTSGFSEGSARHYRWHAIPDLSWYANAMGKDYLAKELNQFMKDASLNRAGVYPGSGWWVGNQHNYHAPYMFNEAGRPDLTQKWVRWTLSNRFADRTDGLDGNDDLGALSAWYVLSAMGIFAQPGTDRYWVGSPNVDKATLNLGGGKTLVITAANQSAKNVYVKSVKLNGKLLEGTTFTHSQIKDGGTLEFVMASKP